MHTVLSAPNNDADGHDAHKDWLNSTTGTLLEFNVQGRRSVRVRDDGGEPCGVTIRHGADAQREMPLPSGTEGAQCRSDPGQQVAPRRNDTYMAALGGEQWNVRRDLDAERGASGHPCAALM